MLNHQTLEKLHALRLTGMAGRLSQADGRRGDGASEL
jgi:hypothetical protein